MANDIVITGDDLADNPTARVPVCLVLDRSPSMNGAPIDALNEGVRHFFASLAEDEVARYSAEVAVVSFSGSADRVLDFGPVGDVKVPTIGIEHLPGGTSIGRGVELALELLDERKRGYAEAGVDYFQPWLVLMTDGLPTDHTHVDVSAEVARRDMERKITVFPIGVGDGADMDTLAMFSPRKTPLRLKGLNFGEFFEWLSASVAATSQSVPGEAVKLDTDSIKSWAEL